MSSNSELLSVEALAANNYFRQWQKMPINWANKSAIQIPDDWKFFGQRESKISGENRNASHPINAILNYAYALLESKVRIACAALGLDASISYLHAKKNGRDSLVYDPMEFFRADVDRRIIEFIGNSSFSPKDFPTSIHGVCKLNPQFAKRIAHESIPDSAIQERVKSFRDLVLASSG